jgi:hypothetical protein
MIEYNFDNIVNNDLLAYKYLRGSWCHGIGVEGKSDYDYGGVYFAPLDMALGLRSGYLEQVSDKKSDETYYEFGRWMELLLKSNPTVLESLFIDKKFIIGDVHPIIQEVIDNREKFLSKEAFNPLIGYTTSQISKSQGYNKKCMYPEDMARKGILDFCYTFKDQGSIPFKEWLDERDMKQEYCGLVNVPNMFEMYSVFYDWGAHIQNEKYSPKLANLMLHYYGAKNSTPLGYRGIVSANDDSNEVRLSSVEKGAEPICYMEFSKNAYQSHCRIYHDWVEWKKNRNEIRYNDNKGYNYDAKNMCECVRLLHTGIELAKGEGFNVTRTWDRDFLLDIKAHKYTYDELMEYVVDKKKEFESYYETCTLPDHIDRDFVNKFLIDSRKKLYII